MVEGHALQRLSDRPRVPHQLTQGTELRQSPAAPDQQSEVRTAGHRHALAQQRVRCRKRNPVFDMVESIGREPHPGKSLGGIDPELTQQPGNLDQAPYPLHENMPAIRIRNNADGSPELSS
jgi:hypothetical protein